MAIVIYYGSCFVLFFWIVSWDSCCVRSPWVFSCLRVKVSGRGGGWD